MTSHRERAEKFLRSIMTRSPSPDEISHVESAFREVEAQALERAIESIEYAGTIFNGSVSGREAHETCADIIRALKETV